MNVTCVKCKHNFIDRHGECRQCLDWKRHVCVFDYTPIAKRVAAQVERWLRQECGLEGSDGMIEEIIREEMEK